MKTAVEIRPDFVRARLELARLEARVAQSGAAPKEFRSPDGNPQILVQVYPNRNVVTIVTCNPPGRPANIPIAINAAGRAPMSYQAAVSHSLYERTDTYEAGSYTLSVTSTETGSGIRAGNEVRFVVE